MLEQAERDKLFNAATEFALAVIASPNGQHLVSQEVAHAFARQHGFKTFIECETVNSLGLLIIERRGDLLKRHQSAFVMAMTGQRADDETLQ